MRVQVSVVMTERTAEVQLLPWQMQLRMQAVLRATLPLFGYRTSCIELHSILQSCAQALADALVRGAPTRTFWTAYDSPPQVVSRAQKSQLQIRR
jgi:hypothetical protein